MANKPITKKPQKAVASSSTQEASAERKSQRLVSPKVTGKQIECPGCNHQEFFELADGNLECAKCHLIVELPESA